MSQEEQEKELEQANLSIRGEGRRLAAPLQEKKKSKAKCEEQRDSTVRNKHRHREVAQSGQEEQKEGTNIASTEVGVYSCHRRRKREKNEQRAAQQCNINNIKGWVRVKAEHKWKSTNSEACNSTV